ncbi:hypothetical protein TNCV_1759591 [Trichonephila clavipes]|nr:hypothetical protein TNCV_1759591 [Trichonephila clavipes]
MLHSAVAGFVTRLECLLPCGGGHVEHILIARSKKPYTVAEELILPAAIEIVETMFGNNIAKELQSIPLSNDTVSRSIDDFAEDVQQQLFGNSL